MHCKKGVVKLPQKNLDSRSVFLDKCFLQLNFPFPIRFFKICSVQKYWWHYIPFPSCLSEIKKIFLKILKTMQRQSQVISLFFSWCYAFHPYPLLLVLLLKNFCTCCNTNSWSSCLSCRLVVCLLLFTTVDCRLYLYVNMLKCVSRGEKLEMNGMVVQRSTISISEGSTQPA